MHQGYIITCNMKYPIFIKKVFHIANVFRNPYFILQKTVSYFKILITPYRWFNYFTFAQFVKWFSKFWSIKRQNYVLIKLGKICNSWKCFSPTVSPNGGMLTFTQFLLETIAHTCLCTYALVQCIPPSL